jgi:hypothetical protein
MQNLFAPSVVVALLAFGSHARAQTEVFGCDANPPGSLAVLAGEARVGGSFTIGLDNPLGTQSAGALGVLALTKFADAAFPCGTPAYGLSMAGPSFAGELLVDLGPASLVSLRFTTPFGGPGAPATATYTIPANAALVGVVAHVQGFLLDVSGTTDVVVGATRALRLDVESACSTLAPCVTLVAQQRSAYAESRAFDYDYDNGESHAVQPFGVANVWSDGAAVDHSDWYGTPIGTSAADVTTFVGSRRVAATFALAAETFGNLFQEDAYARGELAVAFDVPSRVRFVATASGSTSGGYGEAYALVKSGANTLFSMGAFQGQSDTRTRSGWLQPGAHTIDVRADVFAYGGSGGGGFSEQHTADLGFEFVILAVADFDADGDVDADDAQAFGAAFVNGSLDTDVNGDGSVDSADASLFDAAWLAAQ